MFIDKFKSDGLAHLSYLVGDEKAGVAAVVDPRRDIDCYLEAALRLEVSIRYIFETHRNEDYVIGSQDLARATGATIHHGEGLAFEYGETVSHGDSFDLGAIRLQVISTPGHTFESISLALTDTDAGDAPVAAFTGDALFVGDVGRTDFFPDRAREVAGLLYDSIFERLLPLGDHVLLYPAHGAGSVCGSSLASREFSTLGHERLTNRALQVDSREEFVENKVNEHHSMPPYFKVMERYNQKGAPPMDRLPHLDALSVEELSTCIDSNCVVLDIRSPEAYAGASIPGSLSMPTDMIPAYAGWFLPYNHQLYMVADSSEQLEKARRHLVRIGYDRQDGYLAGGMTAWETAGKPFQTIPAVTARHLMTRIERHESFTLLDVRHVDEYEQEHLPDAINIPLGQLPNKLEQLPRDRLVVTFCGSGRRAMIAASILKRNGFDLVEDCLGSMAACAEVHCQTV